MINVYENKMKDFIDMMNKVTVKGCAQHKKNLKFLKKVSKSENRYYLSALSYGVVTTMENMDLTDTEKMAIYSVSTIDTPKEKYEQALLLLMDEEIYEQLITNFETFDEREEIAKRLVSLSQSTELEDFNNAYDSAYDLIRPKMEDKFFSKYK